MGPSVNSGTYDAAETIRRRREWRRVCRSAALALIACLWLFELWLLLQSDPNLMSRAPLSMLPMVAPFVYLLAFLGWSRRGAIVVALGFLTVASALPPILVGLGLSPIVEFRPLLAMALAFAVSHSLLIGLTVVVAGGRSQASAADRTIEELGQLVRTDSLTGVLNRRGFVEALRREAARAEGRACGLALVLIDLDHFKRVNDRWGHPVGDRVLQAFAARLEDLVRSSDVVGRWGGEEFVVMMRRPAPGEALFLADRLRRAIEESTFPTVGAMTASFGVAEMEPGVTIEAVLDAADEALYRAKAQGRNRTCASRRMMDKMTSPGARISRP